MMYHNLLLALLALPAALAAALPSPMLEKRACTTANPSVYVTYSKPYANSNEPNTIAMQRGGGPGSNFRKAGITFNIPAGSTGCALHFALPAITVPNQVAVGANTVDVFGASPAVTSATTWDTQPATTTKWASFNAPDYVTGASSTILLSDTCKTTMSYVLQLADWQQNQGQVFILQSPPSSGFYMTYNC